MTQPTAPSPRDLSHAELRDMCLRCLRSLSQPVGVTVVLQSIRTECGHTPTLGVDHRVNAQDVRLALEQLRKRGLVGALLTNRLQVARAKWIATPIG
jgi:hypothetical protein